ncbi:MAG: class II aldolase/adducin family protein [Clostridia bacterium]|nr:class II aldolase/adducin family protein [Clostridia bacterium]
MLNAEIPYPSDAEAIAAIIDIGKKLYTKGMVASNDGNISVRVGNNAVWITPTGVSKGELVPDILLKLTLNGEIIEGNTKKSTETAMHLRMYTENSEIRTVVHAHPAFATAFAIAGIPFDSVIYPEAYAVIGAIPIAPYATPGTHEVPDSVAPFAKTHNAVLLSNHGALTWGKTPKQAWFRMESLENYARITMYSKYFLGQANPIPEEKIKEIQIFD